MLPQSTVSDASGLTSAKKPSTKSCTLNVREPSSEPSYGDQWECLRNLMQDRPCRIYPQRRLGPPLSPTESGSQGTVLASAPREGAP